MLTLSRYENQSINLHLPDGKVIRVLVVRIGHGQVKLGIDAPDEVLVLRQELENFDGFDRAGFDAAGFDRDGFGRDGID